MALVIGGLLSILRRLNLGWWSTFKCVIGLHHGHNGEVKEYHKLCPRCGRVLLK